MSSDDMEIPLNYTDPTTNKTETIGSGVLDLESGLFTFEFFDTPEAKVFSHISSVGHVMGLSIYVPENSAVDGTEVIEETSLSEAISGFSTPFWPGAPPMNKEEV